MALIQRASTAREADAFRELIGQSLPFQRVLERVRMIADSEATVLIEGETGTGKELIARAIHHLSARHCRPFVAVNCGAVPDSLIEDELFGHERGAFTDARSGRTGLMRAAEHGTLCLDEVGSLSSRAQIVLLRTLQERTFRSLGTTREDRIDVRFIALSNTPLAQLVDRGVFRLDLLYRLRVLTLNLPPLRARRQDIGILAIRFLRKYRRPDSPELELSPAAAAALETYDWPGNVRELENTMLRLAHTIASGRVELEDLDLAPAPALDGDTTRLVQTFHDLKRQTIELFERNYLTNLMRHCQGNVTQAARVSGKDRRDLGKC
jgi:DNA-binding NtrC family response regulator